MEKWSFKTCYSILICSNLVICLTIYWAVNYKWLYLVFCCLSMTLEGGHFTLMPIIYGRLFKNQGTMMFTIGFACFGFSSLMGIFVVKFLLDVVIGYLGIFLICAALQAGALAILWIFFSEVPLEPKE